MSQPGRRCPKCGVLFPFEFDPKERRFTLSAAWHAHDCSSPAKATQSPPQAPEPLTAKLARRRLADEIAGLRSVFPGEMAEKQRLLDAYDARTDLLQRLARRLEAHPGIADDLMSEAWKMLDEPEPGPRSEAPRIEAAPEPPRPTADDVDAAWMKAMAARDDLVRYRQLSDEYNDVLRRSLGYTDD